MWFADELAAWERTSRSEAGQSDDADQDHADEDTERHIADLPPSPVAPPRSSGGAAQVRLRSGRAAVRWPGSWGVPARLVWGAPGMYGSRLQCREPKT